MGLLKQKAGSGMAQNSRSSFPAALHRKRISAAGRQRSGTCRFSGKRILIAEDNDLNAEIAAGLLAEMGFEAEQAQNGDICVSMMGQAEGGYYDRILMDIQMPSMNGYQAAEAIRKMDDPAKAGIPIAAVAANAFEENEKALMPLE